MNFLELAQRRYSVRGYLDKPVEKEKLEYVLESARLAPSATNAQPWHLYVVTDEKTREELLKSYPREWVKNVPVIIVVCVKESGAWVRKYDDKNHADIDGAIITEHICLAAADCGLGTCWICAFDPALCSEALNLPKDIKPIAITPLGYPATDNIPEKKRKPMDEIVTFL